MFLIVFVIVTVNRPQKKGRLIKRQYSMLDFHERFANSIPQKMS